MFYNQEAVILVGRNSLVYFSTPLVMFTKKKGQMSPPTEKKLVTNASFSIHSGKGLLINCYLTV